MPICPYFGIGQVTLLWQRAINDPEFKRVFCLVHAERLSYQVSDEALRSLNELSQGRRGWLDLCNYMYMHSIMLIDLCTVGYRLVIICSNEEEEKSHIISKLHTHRRPFAQICDTDQCQSYLKDHFTGKVESLSYSPSQMQLVTAPDVDYEKYTVHIILSLYLVYAVICKNFVVKNFLSLGKKSKIFYAKNFTSNTIYGKCMVCIDMNENIVILKFLTQKSCKRN